MGTNKKSDLTVRQYDWNKDDLSRLVTAYNRQFGVEPDPRQKKQTS